MTNKHLSIFNQLRPVTVGFDNMFDHFERMFDEDFSFNVPTVNFPPYNIVKTGDFTYDVELALAGFSKDDITVDYADNVLTVKPLRSQMTTKTTVYYTEVSKKIFQKRLQSSMM